MRIALNMLYVAPGVAGGRIYADGLLSGLGKIDSPHDFAVFTRRGTTLVPLPSDRFTQIEAPIAQESILWRTVWEYGFLGRAVGQAGANLFHGLGTLSPTAKVPTVLTIHDINYVHFPANFSKDFLLFIRAVLPRVARRAARIIVPSEFTARDIIEHLAVDEKLIRLVHYGPGQSLPRVTETERLEELRKKYGIDRPFALSVARGYASKNLAGLLRAWSEVCRYRATRFQLVMVGDRYRSTSELDTLRTQLHLQNSVIFADFVPYEDLCAFYSAASVYVFPSLAEGFGLPVLEAMTAGLPVIASNASAVPEAVGDAGLVANARNAEEFAGAILRVLDDANFRNQMIDRGHAHVKQFSWEKCAAQTVQVYEELL